MCGHLLDKSTFSILHLLSEDRQDARETLVAQIHHLQRRLDQL